MKEVDNKFRCIPFWSWNDELDKDKLCEQIEWMNKNGVGGFFMHARGGLKTEYLGEKWFQCIDACVKKAKELNMEAYAYDENGWPSGFVGGKLLEDISNHDMYVDYKTGEYDSKADISYELSGETLIKAHSGENCLNIYLKYSSSTADILNPKVVDKFIRLTHRKYKKQDKEKALKGFFTDEPQYYRWGITYTKMLEGYFKKKYHENVLDRIGLLIVEKEGYREYRYKYYSALSELLQNNFAKKVYSWCDKNGYKLTGHFIEETSLQYQMCCSGGVMPLYRYEHIPGIDKLGREPANILCTKQIGSVASQLDKKQVITETYACCGWDVSPLELKKNAESQYVYGVNLMCQHLLPYSEYGQRKRDYPAHFSKINPWVEKDFKTFNDYFAVLGELLSTSTEIVNVAVLHPIKSAFICYDKTKQLGGQDVIALDDSLRVLLKELSDNQLNYHFVDETLLKTYGKVENASLIVGKCKYDYLIIPKVYSIDANTNILLKEYCNNGGKIMLYDEKPEYLEGVKHNFEYLKSNITLQEILASQSVKANLTDDVRSSFRVDKNGNKFIYCVNVSDSVREITFDCNCNSFNEYGILEDKYNIIDKKITLNSGESKILYFSEKMTNKQQEFTTIKLGDKFNIVKEVENYLTIDSLSYSFDGTTYSEQLNCLGVFNELLKKRYKGKLYLKYNFNVKEIPTNCKVIIEKANVENIQVNSEVIVNKTPSSLDRGMDEYDIVSLLKQGVNEIVLTMNYYQSEQVYYALFGENVTESLKNCLVYDSNVEAIYLKGNFGVDGKFSQGNADNVMLGENFSIVKQKQEITRSLVEDGFPFFRGDIVLSQKIDIRKKNCKLVIDKRFHLIEVKVNGEYVGKLMFKNEIDISKYVKVGENDIELNLTCGNRNLFGPFHTLEQENLGVGPNTFERFGTWENGKSKIFRDSYSFVK